MAENTNVWFLWSHYISESKFHYQWSDNIKRHIFSFTIMLKNVIWLLKMQKCVIFSKTSFLKATLLTHKNFLSCKKSTGKRLAFWSSEHLWIRHRVKPYPAQSSKKRKKKFIRLQRKFKLLKLHQKLWIMQIVTSSLCIVCGKFYPLKTRADQHQC